MQTAGAIYNYIYSYNSLHAKMVILSSYSTFIATHTGQDKLVKTGSYKWFYNYKKEKVSNEMEDRLLSINSTTT